MAPRPWNWQLAHWPEFRYDEKALEDLEALFIRQTGKGAGVLQFIDEEDREKYVVEILTTEAMQTAEIEGEILNRDSVQSSVKKFLGLQFDPARRSPAEEGMARLTVDIYRRYNAPLTQELLSQMNALILAHRPDLDGRGRFRTHPEPMQVVSGSIGRRRVHFEAPPSEQVPREMEVFLQWFNANHRQGKLSPVPLTLAGITHFHFINIHPFEDGNGRMARALTLKSVAMSMQQPVLLSLSARLSRQKKDYYAMLGKHNHSLDITEWLVWYGRLLVDAQKDAVERLEWMIRKIRFLNEKGNLMNERQRKVVLRLFDAGPEGFAGGLSAKNYRRIARTSESTATRDLQDLVQKGILFRKGERKATRYYLHLD